jgi:hypothetical protein
MGGLNPTHGSILHILLSKPWAGQKDFVVSVSFQKNLKFVWPQNWEILGYSFQGTNFSNFGKFSPNLHVTEEKKKTLFGIFTIWVALQSFVLLNPLAIMKRNHLELDEHDWTLKLPVLQPWNHPSTQIKLIGPLEGLKSQYSSTVWLKQKTKT